MASLGPLIQSSTNVEAPPGEDGSNVASDGTSVDAVSYSYLKLELELKNQEWMVKCLSQWEELVHFGWRLEQYSAMTFNCLKSLGYYFNLVGNSYFRFVFLFFSFQVSNFDRLAPALQRTGLVPGTADGRIGQQRRGRYPGLLGAPQTGPGDG